MHAARWKRGSRVNKPFWYGNCWAGSINGGGENGGEGYFNGAYWAGTAKAWGTDNGQGAGNGWMFVNEAYGASGRPAASSRVKTCITK